MCTSNGSASNGSASSQRTGRHRKAEGSTPVSLRTHPGLRPVPSPLASADSIADSIADTEAWLVDVIAGRADDDLGMLLHRWRREIHADLPPALDPAIAVTAVRDTIEQRNRVSRLERQRARRRLLAAPIAAAVAGAVMCGGVAIGAYHADPASDLWPVTQTLYGDHARSVAAAYRVETRIDSAKRALTQGRSDVARGELDAAAADLVAVEPGDGQAELASVHDFLAAKAAETPAGVPVDPGAPLRTDPARPVPVGAKLGVPVLLSASAGALTPTIATPAGAPVTTTPTVPAAPTTPGGGGTVGRPSSTPVPPSPSQAPREQGEGGSGAPASTVSAVVTTEPPAAPPATPSTITDTEPTPSKAPVTVDTPAPTVTPSPVPAPTPPVRGADLASDALNDLAAVTSTSQPPEAATDAASTTPMPASADAEPTTTRAAAVTPDVLAAPSSVASAVAPSAAPTPKPSLSAEAVEAATSDTPTASRSPDDLAN